MSEEMKDDAVEFYKYYLTHPVEFVETQIMGLTVQEIKADKVRRRLECAQKSMIYNVGKYDRVSVFSGRGGGSTYALASLAIWFLATRNNARVCIVDPDYRVVKQTLWLEIKKLVFGSLWVDVFEFSKDTIYTKVKTGMGSRGSIFKPKNFDLISGVLAEHVLWIVTNPAYLDDKILESILGSMSDPESRIVMAGQPCKTSGLFYESQHKDKKLWKCLQFNSEDSSLVSPVWLKRMAEKYPRESDEYRVIVRGLPPKR